MYFEVEKYEMSQNNKINLAGNHNSIGLIYTKLGLNDEALASFRTGLELAREIKGRKTEGLLNENIGIIYADTDQYEKADSFYNEALKIYKEIGYKALGGIYNNLATLHIRRGQYEESLIVLDKALKINQDLDREHGIAWNYSNFGAAHLKLKNYDRAEKYLLDAVKIWTELGDVYEQKTNAENLAILYKEKSNEEKSTYFAELARVASDSIFGREKLMEVNKVMVQNLTSKHENQKNDLTSALLSSRDRISELELNENSRSGRLWLLLLLGLILILIGFFWTKRKSPSSISPANQGRALSEENSDDLKKSLEERNKQLTILSLEAAQNNEFLENLHVSIKSLVQKNPESQTLHKLEKSLSANKLGQHNWDQFISYFNESYNGFFDRITSRFPSITNKDLRLCALIRLRIPSYEAGIILGISSRSVHKARYRIRKKMGVDSENSLEDFICSI